MNRSLIALTALASLALAIVIAAPAAPAAAQSPAQDERAAVTRTVDRFFDAMQARDRATLESLVIPEGRGIALREGAAETPAARSLQALIDSLLEGEADILERMWRPEVRVEMLGGAGIATLWAPYDFWIDGTRHHCGIDAFQLLNTGGDWRIANVVWTSQETNCPESPLPDPK